MAEALLQTVNLVKSFPLRRGFFGQHKLRLTAVDRVSMTLGESETMGLVGESGSGKSTLGLTIMRLYQPTSGQIHFGGQELAGMAESALQPVRRQMQMIFQDPFAALDPRLTVAQIIAEPLNIHNIGTPETRATMSRQLLERVGLSAGVMGRYPNEFSGGQQQRIGIARALALQPRLMICDEPVSALDVSVQAQILNLLRDLQDEFKLAYLFISHNIAITAFMSHRIGVMYLGRLVEIAPSKQLVIIAAPSVYPGTARGCTRARSGRNAGRSARCAVIFPARSTGHLAAPFIRAARWLRRSAARKSPNCDWWRAISSRPVILPEEEERSHGTLYRHTTTRPARRAAGRFADHLCADARRAGRPLRRTGDGAAADDPRSDQAQLNAKYGLDKPVWQQYLVFLGNAVRLDFGYSFTYSTRTVVQIFQQQWPYSIQLGLLTLVFSMVVGLGLGILAAIKQGSWVDHTGTLVSIFCLVMPSFVFAILLQFVLSVRLGWLPTGGWNSPKQWIMPVLANSLGPILILQRYTRSSMADVMRANYVRTARAKGMSEQRVMLIHVFKNALTPVVTVGGPMIAGSDHRLVFCRKHLSRAGDRAVFRDCRAGTRLSDDYGDDAGVDRLDQYHLSADRSGLCADRSAGDVYKGAVAMSDMVVPGELPIEPTPSPSGHIRSGRCGGASGATAWRWSPWSLFCCR